MRLAAIGYILLCAACVIYFWMGDAIVDPSFEYGAEKRMWLAITQWLALLGPIAGGWLLYRLSPHLPED